MKTILTPDQMRALENNWFTRTGRSFAELMHNAAMALTRAMLGAGLVSGRTIGFLCGNGGNGGDGVACAIECEKLGAKCFVVLAMPRDRARGDMLHFLSLLPDSIPVLSLEESPEPDVWVDAVFGIGLNRAPEGLPLECIHRMNTSPAVVVSVDIASGLDGLTGNTPGEAVVPDITVTFECAKTGHYLRSGADHLGRLIICPIGIEGIDHSRIPAAACGIQRLSLFEEDDARLVLPERRRFSHKNTYGHLLIAAGSVGMAGAAVIAAKAALHSGAGLVTVACPGDLLPILQMQAPEAMCVPLPQNDSGAISANAVPKLLEALRGKTAVAVGPGLSRNAAPEALEAVLRADIPSVIDADALNILSGHDELKALLRETHVITPHPGEAARLLHGINDEITMAGALKAMGCTALLKGTASLISAKDGICISATGSPCMAKGGSGDMLTGIIGALLARGVTACDAALLGSHIHGRTGELAEAALGMNYPTAMDLIGNLAQAWQEIES